jgi:hypothetical protein
MAPPLVFPPAVIIGKRFPNVFVFPRTRIVDPGNNVLLAANLFNFGIDKVKLQPDHETWLGTVAAPLLRTRPSGGARLTGLASRSGSDSHNLLLSLRRARSAQTTLTLFLVFDDIVNPPGPTPRISVGAQGDHFAANIGVKKGTEDERFRSVLVILLADRTKFTPVRLLPPT